NRAVALGRQTGALPPPGKFQESSKVVDTLLATIQDMQIKEAGLLDRRMGKAKAARRLTSLIAIIGALVGVGFLLLAGLAINREIGMSAQARAQISAVNVELEQRIEERTAALTKLQ